MHTHPHHSESTAQTEGRLVPWASFYDLTVNLMTLGHADHLRQLTLDQALLKPGESILDVGCGTGGVTIPAKIRVGENGGRFETTSPGRAHLPHGSYRRKELYLSSCQ